MNEINRLVADMRTSDSNKMFRAPFIHLQHLFFWYDFRLRTCQINNGKFERGAIISVENAKYFLRRNKSKS